MSKNLFYLYSKIVHFVEYTVAEFKEFERRFKYGWYHLKLYQMFQDLSRPLI